MPLFSSNKFLSKKTPQRKTFHNFPKRKAGEEENLKFEIDKIRINVGEQRAVFEDGEWIPEGGVGGQRVQESLRSRQQLQQLESENNLLKLKIEVLLDMDAANDSKNCQNKPKTITVKLKIKQKDHDGKDHERVEEIKCTNNEISSIIAKRLIVDYLKNC
ncbi:protein chibby homolog 1 isoform X1 [Macrosteles quadrilineatus]|uniref:protein chibby homolog 1 isoform X1 n=1 Tax=Macrosteles quadrilineatus TaxID=74068 RepID=UPI0023E1A141|nr:protein chibby homolog 1 isoform X1 [Macrosteles quadrilineatus]